MRLKKFKIMSYVFIAFFILFQLSFVYRQYNHSIESIGNTAITISKSVKEFIDANKYKNIVESRKKDDYFYEMQNYISKVQKSTSAEYIYVERKINDREVEYIFDSEKDSFGDVDSDVSELELKSTNLGSVTTKIVNYQIYGKLISAFTPIVDENNNVIGLVGVDFTVKPSLQDFYIDLQNILSYVGIMMLFFISYIVMLKKKRDYEKNDLEQIYKNIINSLFKSLEKKSNYTYEHSKKVAKYSVILAKELGITENELKIIEYAAMLHDIGKIGIPETILNKPGRLTAEEYELIKCHPIYSKEILSEIFQDTSNIFNLNEFKIITDIASFHHERYDGMGYPNNLKGYEIPLFSRIVSVADSFEAMIAKRPYKKELSRETAIEQIRLNAGTQFDPKIVEIFLICIEKNLL